MTRLVRGVMTTLMCLILCPALASAQDEAFKRGIQARGDKKWAEAERQMRSAIQSNGQESNRKVRLNIVASVFGAGSIEYLPHYFLGEALYNQKDCAGAVAAWAASLDQRVVQGVGEFKQGIDRGFKDCGGRGVLLPAEFDSQLKSSRQAYVDANALAKKITDLGAAHRDQWSSLESQYDDPLRDLQVASARLQSAMRTRSASDFAEVRSASDRAIAKLRPLEEALNAAIANVASLQQKIRDVEQAIGAADGLDKSIDGLNVALDSSSTASRNTARQQLAQAGLLLGAARKSQNAVSVNDAMKTVQTATATLNQVLERLEQLVKRDVAQRVAELVRGADEAFASFSALMATLDGRLLQRADKVTPEMTTQRDALQKQIETQRRRFERARTKQDFAGLADVTRQTREAQASLDSLLSAFGPLTLRERGVHPALEEGANLFLQGEYEKAIAALDPSTGVGDSAQQLHVHLFRAASLYQLFVRSGERRSELRAKALEEIAQCRQISSTFEPDVRVFAPRFITLYKTGGAAAPQTATATTQQ